MSGENNPQQPEDVNGSMPSAEALVLELGVAMRESIMAPAPHTDIVVDLETLDTTPSAVVLSIGAYKLSEWGIVIENSGIHLSLKIADQIVKGRTISNGTLSFWRKQNQDAQDAAFAEVLSVEAALQLFHEYVTTGAKGRPRIWGNGVSFDNTILSSLYHYYGRNPPWSYTQDSDFRTLRQLFPFVDKLEFEGTRHHAMHDALHEARGLSELIRRGLVPKPTDPMTSPPEGDPTPDVGGNHEL